MPAVPLALHSRGSRLHLTSDELSDLPQKQPNRKAEATTGSVAEGAQRSQLRQRSISISLQMMDVHHPEVLLLLEHLVQCFQAFSSPNPPGSLGMEAAPASQQHWVPICAGSARDRVRIWVAAVITDVSDGQTLLKAFWGGRFPIWSQGCLKICFLLGKNPLSRPGKEKCQLCSEAGGLGTARHAGNAQNAQTYLDAKQDTRSCRQGWSCALFLQPRGLCGAKTVPSVAERVFLSPLVEQPHPGVLVSGEWGMDLPRNPVKVISLDVTASPFL